MAYIDVQDVYKRYKIGENTVVANNGVNFSIEKGEFVVILGPSGAGKSTILNILGGMDNCDEGKIIIDGIDISKFNDRELTKYRRYDVGFVFQFYNLVQNLTARENLELATQISNNALDIDKTLELVGISHRKDNFPAQLSGGEQQRVSIARAIAKNPKLLLCDEPTGALDYNTGKQVLKTLQDTCRKMKTTVIVITHNSAIAQMADRIIKINDAKVRSIELNDNPLSVDAIEW
ncbi:ABC transporter ATP-binding protein [Clostridium sp. 1001271B_151109_B4]|uniref:ABC transporter ATP-binding protein n=1 Tax=Clostridium sp. 1001271B_151109_B4 TaxID=2787148 RepID=UPI0018A9C01A|nr:ABC transporter ATP-binding protein [Clostridium sp. 1001271B_151109_B4]